FGSYNFWDYNTRELGATHGIEAGIRGDYQFSKWLSLESSYSSYVNRTNERSRTTTIHRLDGMGLKMRPKRSLELSFSGGVEIARYLGTQQTTGGIQGGVSKRSGRTIFSFGYHRGFITAVGPGSTLNGDTITASVDRWLSRKVSGH